MRFFLSSILLLVVSSVQANLVDDPQELEGYVEAFPRQEYTICDVPLQGKFYVEPYRNDSIKNVLRSGQIWEPYMLDQINQYAKPGTVALDIGTNIATVTIPLSKVVGDSGTVNAFEPQRKIYRELRMNCQLNGANNVICHRFAIGDKQQIVEMDVETFPGSEGSTNIGHGGDVVEMRTLDSFNFTNVSFIKIDVERSEEQVLDGMVNTILQNRPIIVIELQGGYLWETAPPEIRQKIINSMRKLESLNYKLSRICNHDYLALPL